MRKVAGLVAVLAIAAGCAGTRGKGEVASPKAPATAAASSGSCAAQKSSARPLGSPHIGATVALAEIEGKSIALVADEDARAILAVDVDAQQTLATTPLDGVPSQLLVMGDGRVLVLLRDQSRMQVLEAEAAAKPLVSRCAVATDLEPVALATTNDERTVLVSAAWGKSLGLYDAARLDKQAAVALPREPRAIAVSDDGQTAFVSHAVGGLVSAVDLAKREAKSVPLRGRDSMMAPMSRLRKKMRMQAAKAAAAGEKIDEAELGRMSCQSFALAKSVSPGGRILAPQVFVDPGDTERRTEGYGEGNQPTEAPGIAVLDEGTKAPIDASLAMGIDPRIFGQQKGARDHHEECLLPRAAAVDPRSRTLLVSCFGIDNVIAYDAASGAPENSEKRRWFVGAGPTGIAVDPKKPRAFVFSQFDRTLGYLDLGGFDLVDEKGLAPKQVARVTLPALATPVSAEYALGRQLFHAVGDTRISKDGRACASCHPDGRDDAITWATPDGPRRSIMLAGRVAKTPPYSWNGTERTLEDHLANTFDRLDGTGLHSMELTAVVAYISTMRAPTTAPAPTNDPKVKRGAEIFASKEAGCADCHSPAASLTDGAKHDVQSKAKIDRDGNFNTPSLKFISGTGPYFHDGRYKTLNALLRDIDGKMGHTKHLSEPDLDALEAYLRTL